MTKNIVLTDLKVNMLRIDYEAQCVYAEFILTDDDGKVWENGTGYFWVTMPTNPSSEDFQLPSSYFPTLLQLQTDADNALTTRFLV